MHEDRLNELLSLKLMGKASAEELKELEELLQSRPENSFIAEILAAEGWRMQQQDEDLADSTKWAEKTWQQLEPALQEERTQEAQTIALPRRRPVVYLRWIAAVLTGVALAGGLLYWLGRQHAAAPAEPEEKQIVSQRGARSRVTMPDGTGIWLNSSSRLRYNGRFGTDNRDIWLEGEAYFDVAANPQHPLVIHTAVMDIKVLGTTFNVKAYPEETVAQATLLSGKIDVWVKAGSRHIQLAPKEKITIENGAVNTAKDMDTSRPAKDALLKAAAPPKVVISNAQYSRRDSVYEEVAWVQNRLVFREQSFAQLAVEMERWYNVHIHFKDERLKNEVFNGSFGKENVEQAFKALQLTTRFRFSREGNDIYLWR